MRSAIGGISQGFMGIEHSTLRFSRVQHLLLPNTTLKPQQTTLCHFFSVMSSPSGHAPSELLNGTSFDLVVSTEPRVFTNERKIHFNKTTRVVQRIIIVKLRVSAKHKSPEGMTFVPLFVTDDDLLLEPNTCDLVGEIKDGNLNLNPSFVSRYENGVKRVRSLKITFDIKDERYDLFDGIDGLDDTPQTFHPIHTKVMPPFLPEKRPRSPTPSQQSHTDVDSDENEDDAPESECEDVGPMGLGKKIPPHKRHRFLPMQRSVSDEDDSS